jgi:hypothetical protein
MAATTRLVVPQILPHVRYSIDGDNISGVQGKGVLVFGMKLSPDSWARTVLVLSLEVSKA